MSENSPHLGVVTIVLAGAPCRRSLISHRLSSTIVLSLEGCGDRDLLPFIYPVFPAPSFPGHIDPFSLSPPPPFSFLSQIVLFAVLIPLIVCWAGVSGDAVYGGLERFVGVDVGGGSSGLPD